MRTTPLLTALCCAGLLFAPASQAHHSFPAEFDSNQPVELDGIITKVEWRNPHVFIYLDVEDDTGNYVNWAVELAATISLQRNGWKPDTLKIGDPVTVNASRARDGSPLASGSSVTLEDGTKLRVFGG